MNQEAASYTGMVAYGTGSSVAFGAASEDELYRLASHYTSYYAGLGYTPQVTLTRDCSRCGGRGYLAKRRKQPPWYAPPVCTTCKGTGSAQTLDSRVTLPNHIQDKDAP
jgi:DnaJ-class molecular chaperone